LKKSGIQTTTITTTYTVNIPLMPSHNSDIVPLFRFCGNSIEVSIRLQNI